MGLEGSSEKNPRAKESPLWALAWALGNAVPEPGTWLQNGGSGWPPSGWSRETYQCLKMQAGCCMEPGPCPARAPSQTIRGVPNPPASEFRLRRGTKIRAVSGISCGRGSLKSRRLSRAALPHGGPWGRRGKSTAPACIVLGTPIQCCFSQPIEPPPTASPSLPSCLPSTWTHGVSSEAAWPYRGASWGPEEPHPTPPDGPAEPHPSRSWASCWVRLAANWGLQGARHRGLVKTKKTKSAQNKDCLYFPKIGLLGLFYWLSLITDAPGLLTSPAAAPGDDPRTSHWPGSRHRTYPQCLSALGRQVLSKQKKKTVLPRFSPSAPQRTQARQEHTLRTQSRTAAVLPPPGPPLISGRGTWGRVGGTPGHTGLRAPALCHPAAWAPLPCHPLPGPLEACLLLRERGVTPPPRSESCWGGHTRSKCWHPAWYRGRAQTLAGGPSKKHLSKALFWHPLHKNKKF